jgi:hypothetical protein
MNLELRLLPRKSFSRNICFEFSELVLCSAWNETNKRDIAIFAFFFTFSSYICTYDVYYM